MNDKTSSRRAKVLKAALDQSPLSMADISRKTGVKQSTVARCIKGENCTITVLAAICSALDITVGEAQGEQDYSERHNIYTAPVCETPYRITLPASSFIYQDKPALSHTGDVDVLVVPWETHKQHAKFALARGDGAAYVCQVIGWGDSALEVYPATLPWSRLHESQSVSSAQILGVIADLQSAAELFRR